MKTDKQIHREAIKDIRRQLTWINDAIKEGDQDWIDVLADQLSASALQLHSETIEFNRRDGLYNEEGK